MNDPVLLTIVFLFGAAFGSFLNVLIYRLPRDLSIIKPPSCCPQCHTPIRFYDNIPILSYLILGGKCRTCRTPISPRYLIVEFIAGACCVISFWHYGPTLQGILSSLLLLSFIGIFFIDLEFQIIPDVFTIPGIILGIIASFTGHAFIDWKQALLGALIGGGMFYIVGLLGQMAFRKEALGLGDVKFAAMLGAFLGWKNVLLILVIASFLGSVIGIGLILLSKKKGRSTYVPFGPFLVIAAAAALFWGARIIDAYINLIRP